MENKSPMAQYVDDNNNPIFDVRKHGLIIKFIEPDVNGNPRPVALSKTEFDRKYKTRETRNYLKKFREAPQTNDNNSSLQETHTTPTLPPPSPSAPPSPDPQPVSIPVFKYMVNGHPVWTTTLLKPGIPHTETSIIEQSNSTDAP
jgi:hypothetical protein